MRIPRLLSHVVFPVAFLVSASILAPSLAHASGSPSVDPALLYRGRSQCVAFVADFMAKEYGDLTFYWDGTQGRNANTFVKRAKKAGLPVDHIPAVPSIMYEPVSRYGHVAVVQAVYPDGSFQVKESNYSRGRITTRVLSPSPKLQFIHPKPAETIVVAQVGSDRVMVASAVYLADMSDPVFPQPPAFSQQVPAPTVPTEIPAIAPEIPSQAVPPAIQPKSDPHKPPAGKTFPCLVTAYYSPYLHPTKAQKATALCRMEGCGNGADGTTPYRGMIAASRNYPMGTRIDIPGYGIGEVHDRGGAIHGSHLDAWMGVGPAAGKEASAWGKRHLTCSVL